MVSENILWDTECSNDLVEDKICCRFSIGLKSSHCLFPLHKVVYNDNDILVPPAETGLHIMKSTPHLVKGPYTMTGNKGAGCDRIFLVKI